MVKAVHIVLTSAPYEAIRFLNLKKTLKEIVGELEFELTGDKRDADIMPDFANLSAIEEMENHFLDPSK